MISKINFSFKKIVYLKTLAIVIFSLVISFLPFEETCAQGFEMKEISENVFMVSNPELARQVVIQSEKGLLVFDTFWSEITAREVKNEISKALNRDDFSYVINMADRLDLFGGNAAYEEALIISHENLIKKYQGKEKEVEAEIQDLIEMWRWKEGVSRKRLPSHEKGSEEAKREEAWMNTCKKRADDLESGFSLVFPTISYNDRMTLDLGDITIKLIWFGKEGDQNGLTVAVLPDKKLAIITSFILTTMHLAPNPHWDFQVMDVPRWIAVLEELVEGENAVEQVISHDVGQVLSRERIHGHLVYIRNLWNSVKSAEAAGKDLNEIQEDLSLDKEFAFVKDMDVYKEMGDDWLRPQHSDHIRLFFLQQKELLASEMLKEGGPDGLQSSLARIKNLRESGSDIYFDEGSINQLGYNWMRGG